MDTCPILDGVSISPEILSKHPEWGRWDQTANLLISRRPTLPRELQPPQDRKLFLKSNILLLHY